VKPKAPWEEHAAGWDVIEDGMRLFSLEFIDNDMWYYRFKVIDLNCPKERLIEILNSAPRQPIEGLIYKNRLSPLVVPDEMFCGGYHDEVAVIRDFRPGPPWWADRLLPVLGVMLIIILSLLILEYKMN
jgi:hypothetical protein